jgi:hypothetical protein
MTSKVQKVKPIRKCTKTYANYTSFKPYIREDFNKRCGYCDDLDIYHGGVRGYQIDHFKPHSIPKFTPLKEEYSNLVYSCPFCNRAKSNKWKDVGGFIDPCEDEYDNHLVRNNKGQIIFKTEQGKYIYENLNLHLKRHELLWMIDKLEEQRMEIDDYLNILGEGHELELQILREFRKIQTKIKEYTNLFSSEI